MHFDTLAIHAGQEEPNDGHGARAVPIYQTTSFVFSGAEDGAARFDYTGEGFTYSRTGNPTNRVFEQRVCALEGGHGAVAVGSGIAAVAVALETILTRGDHLISANTIYGGAYALFTGLFPDAGIEVTFVDPSDPQNFAAALRPNTKAIFFETLGNPSSNVTDIEAVATIAHEQGVPLVVDNTFATPFCLRPIEQGADVVLHSATKYMGGHGTTIGGVIVDSGNFDWTRADRYPRLNQPDNSNRGLVFTEAFGKDAYLNRARWVIVRDRGQHLSPFNAFLLLQGLETLPLRMQRHIDNTAAVLDVLTSHPSVEAVRHPALPDSPDHALYEKYFPRGGGAVFTFEVRGGKEAAFAVINALDLFSVLVNVADMKSLVTHPSTTTHSSMTLAQQRAAGIKENSIRLSIGCEDARDLVADLAQALDIL
ncbi:MAG: O-acetylhomoserine aminocarboxypropyltransferase/cysteine synthase [Actinomycetes bacterium]|jgi:O-acetylhomoserine (thiol)-lyase|nr:O-acetylhomoserine aminocarboxypropyltransferase/cysteine synthase [Actinomycetes bacterium]